MNEELKSWIQENMTRSCGGLNPNATCKKWFELKKCVDKFFQILSVTSFLDGVVSMAERIYCIDHDIVEKVRCKCCHENYVNYISPAKGYFDYCGLSCASKNEITREKIRNTSIERYGIENPGHSKEGRQKRKETCIRKYGHEHHMQNPEIMDKMKITNTEKYGNNCSLHCEEVDKKTKRSLMEHYGVDHPSKSKEVREKTKKVWMKRYGVEHPQMLLIPENSRKMLNDSEWLKQEHCVKKRSCTEIGKELDVSYSVVSSHLRKHGLEVSRCFTSMPEKEIYELTSQHYETSLNVRNIIPPFELDLFIAEKKLAIEYNGILWHSFDHVETPQEKTKHLSKTIKCREKDIQLLQIFENEWIDSAKQDVWKSMIASRLGQCERIFARKCEIKEIDSGIARAFLNANHLQGAVGASVKLGLFHKEELVSTMTFGKSRFNKKYEWEMVRFCTKKFTSVIGGASKLLHHFIESRNPESLITYADMRHSNGKMYEKIGLTHLGNSNPNYFYFKLPDLTLYSRVKFQKHKLEKILEIFDPAKSEIENMFANGYRRIWDCGNMVFEWRKHA